MLESKKRNRIDLGILVSHEDGPCGDAPSRSLDLPELVAVWNRSQKARPEIIAEMEDWTLSGDWWLRRFGGMRRQGRLGDEGPEGVCGVDDISGTGSFSPSRRGSK